MELEPAPEPEDEPLPDPEPELLPPFDPEFDPDPADDPGVPDPLLPGPGCDTEGVGEGVLLAVVGLEPPPHPLSTRPALIRTAVKNHEGKGMRAAALDISGPPEMDLFYLTDGQRELCVVNTASTKASYLVPRGHQRALKLSLFRIRCTCKEMI